MLQVDRSLWGRPLALPLQRQAGRQNKTQHPERMQHAMSCPDGCWCNLPLSPPPPFPSRHKYQPAAPGPQGPMGLALPAGRHLLPQTKTSVAAPGPHTNRAPLLSQHTTRQPSFKTLQRKHARIRVWDGFIVISLVAH